MARASRRVRISRNSGMGMRVTAKQALQARGRAAGVSAMTSKKPLGDQGPVHGTGGPEGMKWEKIEFSADKAERKLEFFNLWRSYMKHALGIEVTGVQNEENSFDFTVTFPAGRRVFMDLMEIILPAPDGGQPYAKESDWRKIGDVANHIVGQIIAKSKKYGRAPPSGLHLLLYPTHYEFTLSPADMHSLIPSKIARAGQLVFERIWYVDVLDNETGIGSDLWPVAPDRLLTDERLAEIEKANVLVPHPLQALKGVNLTRPRSGS